MTKDEEVEKACRQVYHYFNGHTNDGTNSPKDVLGRLYDTARQEVEKELEAERKKNFAAEKYIRVLEEYWGLVPDRISPQNNPVTYNARADYLKSKETQ